MRTKSLFGIVLLFLCAIGFVSCGDDDDPKIDPEGTITLSMLNETNGKTLLGESGVYLDKVNNFVGGNSAFITDLGTVPGLGNVDDFRLLTPSRQMAAQVGHGYWVYDQETVMQFPSGAKASRVEDTYYKVYVESMMEENKGIRVRYIPVEIPNPGLLKPDTHIGRILNWGDEIALDIPQDAEVEVSFYPERYNVSYEVREDWVANDVVKKFLFIRLNQSPSSIGGNVDCYLRIGDVFTQVYFTAY